MDESLNYDNIKRDVDATIRKIEYVRRKLVNKKNALERVSRRIAQYWAAYTVRMEQITGKFEKSRGTTLVEGGRQGRGNVVESLSAATRELQREVERNERDYEIRVRTSVADLKKLKDDLDRINL